MSKSKKVVNKVFAGKAQITDMKFWRGLAAQLLPDVKDDWKQSEAATMLFQIGDAISTEFEHASRICDKNDGKAVTMNIAVKLNRKKLPPEIAVDLKYGERFKRSIRKQVPDPHSPELPFDASAHASPSPTDKDAQDQ